jgi:hypothetical protein
MQMLRRIFTFVRFTLTEYVRSGRILIEVVAAMLFWTLFLRQFPVEPSQFFSLTGIFTILLSLYTTAALLSLGERPQGYTIVTRPLGRSGYLLGYYISAVLVVSAMFLLVTVVTLLYNTLVFQNAFTFPFIELLKGALPLLLNVALLSALMVLLSSMVLSNTLRLVVLAVLAVALYSQAWHLSPIFTYIRPLQSLFSLLIYPAIAGFRLATTREFAGNAIAIPVAQFALTILLLSLALSSFRRRDIILRNQ